MTSDDFYTLFNFLLLQALPLFLTMVAKCPSHPHIPTLFMTQQVILLICTFESKRGIYLVKLNSITNYINYTLTYKVKETEESHQMNVHGRKTEINISQNSPVYNNNNMTDKQITNLITADKATLLSIDCKCGMY